MTIASVQNAIIACERCSRLRAWCKQVAREKVRRFADQEYWGRPVPGFGDPAAQLLVVGLAPAAHGGNRTGRVFTGDSSGDWLYEALHRYGFANQPRSVSRSDGLCLIGCYVTAAGRCAPPANKPAPRELGNCRPWLEAELKLLRDVRVVVTLGKIAHESYLKAAGLWRLQPQTAEPRLQPRGRETDRARPIHERPKFAHGAEALLPNGVTLIASYHPSQQNTNTGKLTRAMWYAVFARARERCD